MGSDFFIPAFCAVVTVICCVITLLLLQDNKFLRWQLDDVIKCQEDIIKQQKQFLKSNDNGSTKKTLQPVEKNCEAL